MSTKQSAIEAAAKGMALDQDGDGAWPHDWDAADQDQYRNLARAAILAYLSAIAEDEASVEACKEAIVKEMDDLVAVYGPDARMFDLNALRVKAVVSTLLERAKEQQG